MATFNSIEFKEFSTYKEVVIFMIQFLRGTQAALNSSQQIFPEGQPIYEKDTHQLKIGDGVNNYSGLPYIGSSGVDVVLAESSSSLTIKYYELGSGHRVTLGRYRLGRNALQGMKSVVEGDRLALWYGGDTQLNFYSIGSYVKDSIDCIVGSLMFDQVDYLSNIAIWPSEFILEPASDNTIAYIRTSIMAITYNGYDPSDYPGYTILNIVVYSSDN